MLEEHDYYGLLKGTQMNWDDEIHIHHFAEESWAIECEMYRTISLMSHLTELILRILLEILRILLERIRGRTSGEISEE